MCLIHDHYQVIIIHSTQIHKQAQLFHIFVCLFVCLLPSLCFVIALAGVKFVMNFTSYREHGSEIAQGVAK